MATSSVAEECDDLRPQIENFWKIEKGQHSPALNLTPMALSDRSATTTTAQLGLVCRKDSYGGSVTLYGDDTAYNAPLHSNECRLIFLLGVKTISAKAGDDVDGPAACGSFDVVR
ncbi:hypothetical protein [uncultured Roseibium sp.]|uniref:hypothetical protein n=1 Tax=uncultured Roseibium sp. TaxID=1936171 RepID=UPI0032174340